jgi:RHS repeat-associated protein
MTWPQTCILTSIDTVRINLLGTVSFQYDDNGNLIRDGQRIMTYNAEDQLVGLVVTDGIYNLTQSGFIYDGLRRVRVRTEASWQANAWVTNQVVRYVYDGMQVLQEQDGSNQAQVTYTRGLDLSGSFGGAGGVGSLLSRSHHSGQTVNHFYYYADGNGNVATLVNASETVVAEYQYDPFGNLLSMRGALAEGNLYRFSSKEYHPNSGLYYYGYRFYDPNLQRWLNRDPIEEMGGINLYQFVFNNPVNLVDLWGLSDDDFVELPANLDNANPCAGRRDDLVEGAGQFNRVLNDTLTDVAVQAAAGSLGPVVGRAASGLGSKVGGLLNRLLCKCNLWNKAAKTATDSAFQRMLKAGLAKDKGGLTKAGRALQKHGSRPGSVFPSATGNPAAINQQGQQVLQNILSSQNQLINPNRFGGRDIFDAGTGMGARYDGSGNMMGFLEP